ncbi:glycosyltransferase [Lacticaseibacillus camelliae]|nr:glycosyltransferase [Lacticaseibacillus camelliae]
MNRAETAVKYGLNASSYVNLLDFVCGIPFDYHARVTLASLGVASPHVRRRLSPNEVDYYDGNQLVETIYHKSLSEQVQLIRYYDAKGRYRIEEEFDSRGFVGVRRFYDENQQMTHRDYLSPAGRLCLRVFISNSRDSSIAAIQVFEPDGRLIQLSGEQTLRRYFFDKLNLTTERNVFVSDRTRKNGWALEHMTTNAFKLFHLHNVHAQNLRSDPASTRWNESYRQALNNLDLWQGGIVLTDQQLADVTRTLPRSKFFKVPAVVITQERLSAPHVSLKQRTPGKIVAVARIDRQKNLEELVQIIALIHQQRADVTLDIWGLVQDRDYQAKIEFLIQQLHLTQVVKMRGFSDNIGQAYDQAQLMILTSRVEGTVLALAEAQSHGVPVISYDFKYGPREFIIPGENGAIVPVGARQNAAELALTWLNDAATWQQYSEGAYRDSRRYDAETVFGYWRHVKTQSAIFYGKE